MSKPWQPSLIAIFFADSIRCSSGTIVKLVSTSFQISSEAEVFASLVDTAAISIRPQRGTKTSIPWSSRAASSATQDLWVFNSREYVVPALLCDGENSAFIITEVSITRRRKIIHLSLFSCSSGGVDQCLPLLPAPQIFLQTLKFFFGLQLQPGYVPVDSPDLQVPASPLCIRRTF